MPKLAGNPSGLKTVHEIALDVLLANLRRGLTGRQLAIEAYELADEMRNEGLRRELDEDTLPMKKAGA